MNEKEVWKPIKDFEGLYEISNLVKIRGINRNVKHPTGSLRKWKGRTMQLQNLSSGYLIVQLSKDGIAFPSLVHRLIAEAFIPNPENKPCVNHLNGIKDDDRPENLAWCTYSENEKHSYSHLGKKANKTNLGKLGILSFDAIPVMRTNLKGVIIGVWGSASEAARFLGGTQGRISANARRESKSCYNSYFYNISKEKYFELIKIIKNEPLGIKRKLSEDDVKKMRRLYTGKRGEISRLAEKFNIHNATARNVIRNIIWKKIA